MAVFRKVAMTRGPGLVSSSRTLEIRGNVKQMDQIPSLGSGRLSLSVGRPSRLPLGGG